MWRLEKDPHLSSTFAAVSILDRSPDFDRLLARLERAVHVVERLGQRVQPAPVNLTAPTWVPDSNFDLRYHVRHIALPKPGTMRQLLDLASLIACDPFDRTRPLWQFVVVDGLRGRKSALIEKLHHTITDGEGSGISLQPSTSRMRRGRHRSIMRRSTTNAAQCSSNDVFHDSAGRPSRGIVRQVMDLSEPTGIPDAAQLRRHRARRRQPAQRSSRPDHRCGPSVR
jgi:hypothetical protein